MPHLLGDDKASKPFLEQFLEDMRTTVTEIASNPQFKDTVPRFRQVLDSYEQTNPQTLVALERLIRKLSDDPDFDSWSNELWNTIDTKGGARTITELFHKLSEVEASRTFCAPQRIIRRVTSFLL